MRKETVAARLRRHPKLSLALMMISGFCLLVMTGIFAPKAIALIEVIDTHGFSGMGWREAIIMLFGLIYGTLGFFSYLAFRVFEKAVVDNILTSQ